ncbi:MAG: lipid IV(A) 3-deoxy-D-manno-octulosonic acid transferase [Neisseria sp.]|nr:lipid IV(A) 3-deoxy-D-manno-octulosonic acid transferase [Neisseria sp.]
MNALFFYRQLWRIAPPLIRRYLKKRARNNPAYLLHWDERFGIPLAEPVQAPIWLHAVSVGETHAAAPLVAALRRRFPDAPLLITQMTPTGRAAAEKLFPEAQCRYLPYDKPEFAAQFLREHRPRFGVLMETEIWPNLMHECREQNVPLFLANARLSEKSARSYGKIRALIAPALGTLRGCFAQTAADASRLAALGAPAPEVAGNTKYDIRPSENALALGEQWKVQAGRPVVVCGSTRVYREEDETALLLQAWRQYRGDALLVIVPRHPERFNAAADTAAALGFKVQRRSSGEPLRADTQVWIGDSMGETAAYYRMADLAFVGGSLVDSGCQNIIEPLACGTPVLFGFSTYNFAEACAGALNEGAAVQVQTADQWRETVEYLLENAAERAKLAANAATFIRQREGAGERMAALIEEKLQKAV